MGKEIITGFPPIANSEARILILGSMPGVQSLNAKQYYAHKQNAFWRILGEITGLDPDAPYLNCTEKLQADGIAVWDVLHSCERIGSLDSAIEAETANDFKLFFQRHPNIQRVYFNGAASERYYRIYVLPNLGHNLLLYHRLPSTSPAHASLRYQEKLAIWKAALTE
ncbi:MAG: DNA-deoxyinosine glycosylase [Methylotenera sp.]|nr:DNA-deoxyinosine glycosylase [Methylotenera sp.]